MQCFYKLYGIYLCDSSYGNTISGYVTDNISTGIYINDSDNTTIDGVHCEDNGGHGISIKDCINMNPWGTTISDSYIINNTFIGIRIDTTYPFTITGNDIEDNGEYGVSVISSDSVDNWIHHNNFTDNNGGSLCQASDSGSNTHWDDGEYGNWWDDYGGSGDYDIDGAGNNKDEYPTGPGDPQH